MILIFIWIWSNISDISCLSYLFVTSESPIHQFIWFHRELLIDEIKKLVDRFSAVDGLETSLGNPTLLPNGYVLQQNLQREQAKCWSCICANCRQILARPNTAFWFFFSFKDSILVFEAPDQVLFFCFKKGSVEPPKLPERELHNWTERELQKKKGVPWAWTASCSTSACGYEYMIQEWTPTPNSRNWIIGCSSSSAKARNITSTHWEQTH